MVYSGVLVVLVKFTKKKKIDTRNEKRRRTIRNSVSAIEGAQEIVREQEEQRRVDKGGRESDRERERERGTIEGCVLCGGAPLSGGMGLGRGIRPLS